MPIADPTADLRKQATTLDTQANTDEAALNAREDAFAKERSQEFSALREKRVAAIGDYDSAAKDVQGTLRQPSEQVKMPDPNLGPPIDPDTAKSFFSGMMALALLGAVGGRQHWMGAAEALNGALMGFREGNMEVARHKKEQFDREYKLAHEKQAEADKRYQRILEDKKLTLNMRAEQVRLASVEFEDWDMNAKALQHDFDGMHRRIDSNRKRADQMQNLAAKLDEQHMFKQMAADAKAAQNETGKLDDDTLHFMAAQYVDTGDRTVFTNLGRGAQGAANITKLRGFITEYAKSKGMEPAAVSAKVAEFEGLKAAERTAGVRGANVDMAVTEADNMAGLVLKTSRAFPRTESMDINRALKNYSDRTGSVESRNFGAAVNSFINAYARAISPSGTPTVSDKEHAREILSTADSAEQVEGLMSLLKQEMAAAQRSPKQVKDSLRRGATGEGESNTVNWNDLH